MEWCLIRGQGRQRKPRNGKRKHVIVMCVHEMGQMAKGACILDRVLRLYQAGLWITNSPLGHTVFKQQGFLKEMNQCIQSLGADGLGNCTSGSHPSAIVTERHSHSQGQTITLSRIVCCRCSLPPLAVK